MNRKLILITLCVAMTLSLQAQEPTNTDSSTVQQAKSLWTLGIHGGAAMEHFSINTQYAYNRSYHGEYGAYMGFFASYEFFDWLRVRVHFDMIQKNYKFSRTGFYDKLHTRYRNTYIDIPVMADFSFGGQKLKGHFLAGGYLGYWLSGHRTGTIYIVDDEVETDALYDFDEAYTFDSNKDNRFDAGLATGAGLSYRFSNNIEVCAEYLLFYGLTSTTKNYMRTTTSRTN